MARTFPDRPLRIIVPYAAGGAADLVARILGAHMTESLGQPVILENRTGANGAIACAYVASSPPDGYTLLVNLGPSHHTLQFFTKNLRYDPIKDFTPITMAATAPQVMLVPASSPIKSITDFVETARSKNGLSYATSGVGTSQHIAGLLLGATQKIKLIHVPYRGAALALNDVVGSQIDAAILVLSNAQPYIENGKLRALGVVEHHRSQTAPEIPTIAEAGLAGFGVPDTWVGFLGPANMPPEIVTQLNASMQKALKTPAVRTQLQKAGYEIVDVTPDAFRTQMTDSVAFYQKLVEEVGIVPE
jgi:tripartite-type tricarboxylate transporter receptor subunit TctC